ncbi:aspartate dehydrogenase domain-containing protein isoform X3 [Brienomyrus brachyistius]|uniref:aspartate dehydrogenase domain-containing protein isoform X3 n=1 Tax=Brienomyrus brachyistius TaxID=42636 RepID=UPI0020B1A9D8|nr:aspartate dehydrogenase domain-containing protein isoform X3 [Brienomyrus brachyistius]
MGESVASIKPSECVNTDHSSARIMTYLDLTAHTLRVMAVGVVGYGHLGQYLVERIQKEGHSLGLRLVFVWNRNPQKLRASVPEELILDQLSHFPEKNADLIVEVCHPQVVKDFGAQFLSHAHFLVGSPSALSDLQLNKQLRQTAQHHGKTLYVPSGALWGSQDIQRLNESESLHPHVQTPLLFPPDGGWAQGLDRGRRQEGAFQRLRGRPLSAGPKQRQHHGSGCYSSRQTGFQRSDGGDSL